MTSSLKDPHGRNPNPSDRASFRKGLANFGKIRLRVFPTMTLAARKKRTSMEGGFIKGKRRDDPQGGGSPGGLLLDLA